MNEFKFKKFYESSITTPSSQEKKKIITEGG